MSDFSLDKAVFVFMVAVVALVLVLAFANSGEPERSREDDCRSRGGEIILTYPVNGGAYITGCRIPSGVKHD